MAGIAELTVAALSGWLMVLVIQAPSALHRVGVSRPKRIRQAHLDLVMMGTIQVAVGAALPALPLWIAALVTLGAVVQPLLFLPLAVRPGLSRVRGFQALVAAVFAATSVGWVALAITVSG
ncbi:hypothetical protein GTY80_09495 [Amycolatopsis sp. SID8362]|nr:hypothetical protein [Amycolatopsis sp. SID8362]